MIIYGLYERDWMDSRMEKYMWSDCVGLGVDNIYMYPDYTLEQIINKYPNHKRVFVESKIHKQTESLYNYTHPKDAIYIFGNNNSGNTNYITLSDDVVHIELDKDIYPWAITILGIILYDRRIKQWLLQ